MPSRPRLNPLSVIFVIGVLIYGVYAGYHKRQPATGGVTSGELRDETTFPVGSADRPDVLDPPRPGSTPTTPPAASRDPGSASPGVVAGKVIKIVDGDTVDILVDERPLRIRLEGIDAPERGQAFGRAARDYLAELCLDQTVYALVLGQDPYGRAVGDVYRDDLWINGELVRAGLAWQYRQYSESVELQQLQQAARLQRVGLWADTNPIAPWEYRRRSTEAAN